MPMPAGAFARVAGLPYTGRPYRRSLAMSKTRVLTGITTTGTPHLGNYVGAIRPAVAASLQPMWNRITSWPTITR